MFKYHKIIKISKSFCLLFILICNVSGIAETKKIVTNFEKYYREWKIYVNSNDSPYSSLNAYTNNEYYKKIENLGISALPHFFSTMKQEGRNLFGKCLWRTITELTKKEFDEKSVKEAMNSEKTMFYKWIRWWEKDRKNVDREFNDLYSHCLTVAYESEKEQILHKIENLGIPALPYAIEKIQEGDEDLIEAVNYWTDDALKNSAEKAGVPREQMRQYCLQWWEQNKDDWLLPPMQEAPEP